MDPTERSVEDSLLKWILNREPVHASADLKIFQQQPGCSALEGGTHHQRNPERISERFHGTTNTTDPISDFDCLVVRFFLQARSYGAPCEQVIHAVHMQRSSAADEQERVEIDRTLSHTDNQRLPPSREARA
jgi:hypothetical protein